MKKILKNIIGAIALTSLVFGAISCGDGKLDDDDIFVKDNAITVKDEGSTGGKSDGSGTNGTNGDDTGKGTGTEIPTWDKAERISSLEGKATNWDKGETLAVPTSYTQRLQSGSFVLFEVTNGDEGYCKFHADDGSWQACGVIDYYTLGGTKINSTEDEKNAGVFNGEGEGEYYFAVTDANLDKLKVGFTMRGHFTLKKIGITNLKEKSSDETGQTSGDNGNTANSGTGGGTDIGGGTATSQSSETSTNKVYGECKTYTVTTTADVEAENFAMVLQLDNDGTKNADGLKVDVTDFELWLKIGDKEAITVKKDKINMIPNQWASPEFGKTDCRFVLAGVTEKVASGTQIQFKVVKATVNNKDKADSIIYCLQKDGGDYGMWVAETDNYKAIFASPSAE